MLTIKGSVVIVGMVVLQKDWSILGSAILGTVVLRLIVQEIEVLGSVQVPNLFVRRYIYCQNQAYNFLNL
jgi:hypothetical protein